MWYVYILVSGKDGRIYVGSKDDLKRRVREHHGDRCESTASRKPLTLNAYVAVRLPHPQDPDRPRLRCRPLIDVGMPPTNGLAADLSNR